MENQVQEQDVQMFDFKAFVFRALSYWKWFLLALIVGVYIVYQQNIREEFPYTLDAKITVQDDKNPLFTSNTSLIFNYGGISGKVQEVLLNLKSREHHEKVVDSLDLYLSYLTQGRFYKTDMYGSVPFKFVGLDSAYQVLGHPIKVEFVDATSFDLSYDFGEAETIATQNFVSKEVKRLPVTQPTLKKRYQIGEYINLPFLKGSIELREDFSTPVGKTYFIQYTSFNSAVSGFLRSYVVVNEERSPLLSIRLTNKNKAKIVDYLNTSIYILDRDQLEKKNQYAVNTINFIDKQLARVKGDLTKKADSLNDFKRDNKLYNLANETSELSNKITSYENQKEAYEKQLISYDLQKFL